jgi:hypothetical protein
MRRISPQKTSDANDRIIFSSGSQSAGGCRNLKRPRHAHHINMFFASTGAKQPITSAKQQPLSDKRIKSRNYNGEASAGSIQLPF